ncbi:hypothetical protein CUZ92_2566 [Enterococcus faecium]|nr:hypothetical protein [Enterococcus faecium]
MKEIEILVPGAYQGKIKKRLQPNSCFEENIKFALDLSFLYLIGTVFSNYLSYS